MKTLISLTLAAAAASVIAQPPADTPQNLQENTVPAVQPLSPLAEQPLPAKPVQPVVPKQKEAPNPAPPTAADPELKPGIVLRVPWIGANGKEIPPMEMPALDPRKLDPNALHQRLQALWLRQPGRVLLSMSELADPNSVRVREVPTGLPNVVLIWKTWTIGGMPYFETTMSGAAIQPPVFGQGGFFPQPTWAAAPLGHAAQAQAFGETGTGVGISVSVGTDGRSHVSESFSGQAAQAQGTNVRTYSAPTTNGGGVSAFSTPQGTQVIRHFPR